MTQVISFHLNGKPTQVHCRADMTVLEWLRIDKQLRGTKEGCAEGDCGACSILIHRPASSDQFLPSNACILLMGQIEGAALYTVEGLASSAPGGHPVQAEMAKNGSSQCGYCTPGIVVALAGLINRTKQPSESQIHDALAGNLCRCTGYRPIVEAAHAAANQQATDLKLSTASAAPLVGSAGSQCHLPASLDDLLNLVRDHPDAALVAGGTDLSLDVAHAKTRFDTFLVTNNVPELQVVAQNDGKLVVGGAVTWQNLLPSLDQHWPSFATLVRRFGSVQIRSMGTMAGNIGTASPIGDGAPALLALDADLVLASVDGERTVALRDYFTGYRQTLRKPNEIIKEIHIPLPRDGHQFRAYKISKRYDQDISTVCGAYALTLTDGVVTDCRMAYGGMAATPMRCPDAEAAIIGQSLTPQTIDQAKTAIRTTFAPMTDMRGTDRYRAIVAENLLDRLVLDLAGETVEVMAL